MEPGRRAAWRATSSGTEVPGRSAPVAFQPSTTSPCSGAPSTPNRPTGVSGSAAACSSSRTKARCPAPAHSWSYSAGSASRTTLVPASSGSSRSTTENASTGPPGRSCRVPRASPNRRPEPFAGTATEGPKLRRPPGRPSSACRRSPRYRRCSSSPSISRCAARASPARLSPGRAGSRSGSTLAVAQGVRRASGPVRPSTGKLSSASSAPVVRHTKVATAATTSAPRLTPVRPAAVRSASRPAADRRPDARGRASRLTDRWPGTVAGSGRSAKCSCQ